MDGNFAHNFNRKFITVIHGGIAE